MADDLQERIAALVAKALAEHRDDTRAPTPRAPAQTPQPATTPVASVTGVVTAGRVVTAEDVTRAAAAGASLHVPDGAIITDLAREQAEVNGVAIVIAGRTPARVERQERQTESDYCTHCGGCMQPAVYERKSRAVARSTRELCDRLDRFTDLAWRSEPNEVRRLRQLSRPPMGRSPGIFYACFNLFWLGEEVQTLRDKAKAGRIPLSALNELLGTLAGRHAGRLSKWFLVDSIELLGDVQNFCEQHGAASYDEFRELCEHLMLAADRIQAWIDRMIPWHTLDARLELVP